MSMAIRRPRNGGPVLAVSLLVVAALTAATEVRPPAAGCARPTGPGVRGNHIIVCDPGNTVSLL
jgi:hypothetical protein